MSNYENNPHEFGWDDTISNDGQEYRLLPEGEYAFTVIGLEKARHQPQPGGKLPPCPKAVLTLRVEDPEDGAPVDMKYSLFLHSSQEWKLCAFFTAIGDRQEGEALRMNWGAVIGKTGRCKVVVRQRTSKQGNTYEANDIDKFLKPEQAAAPAQKWQSGKF